MKHELTTVPFVLHALGILHGIGAAFVIFAVLWLGGVALLSLVPTKAAGERHRLLDHGFPALFSAALFALWCWYGVRLNIGLSRLVVPFAVVSLVLGAARMKHVWRSLPSSRPEWLGLLGWCGTFAIFYVIAYLFFTPNVSGRALPLATYLNNDLMNYLNITRAFQTLGPSNLVADSLLTNRAYFQTPAVFASIAVTAAFYGGDPMGAALPLQFASTALIGLLVVLGVRALFSMSRPWALAIGAATISGPFFRYVEGNYFLSTLVSVPILLSLLWVTVREIKGRRVDGPLALIFGTHYVLLALAYPVLLVLGGAMQACIAGWAAIATALTSATARQRWDTVVTIVARVGVGAMIGLTGVLLALPRYASTAVATLLYLSRPGIAGWPMDMISVRALLGVPGHVDQVQVNPDGALWAVLVLAETGVMIVWLYVWRLQDRASLSERLGAAIASTALILYGLAFMVLGRSYQQWKIASYLPLPLGGLAVAASVKLVDGYWLAARTARWLQETRRAAPFVFLAWCVGGNLWVHRSIEPPLSMFSAALANMQQIDALPFVRSVDVEMDGVRTTFLAPYFIRSKELHLISPSYYKREPLVLDRISRTRPYLRQNLSCAGVGHERTMTISGVGCLMFDPPSPELDASYAFRQTYLFLRPLRGVSGTEDWGRWSDGPSAEWQLTVDSQRVSTTEPLYVNLHLSPYLPNGMQAQHVEFTWGGRSAPMQLSSEGWTALRLEPSDWSGERVREVTFTLTLPDAQTPAKSQGRTDDTRSVAVGFRDLMVSRTPRGVVAAPRPPERAKMAAGAVHK